MGRERADDGGRLHGRFGGETEISQVEGGSVFVGMVGEERGSASSWMFVFYL